MRLVLWVLAGCYTEAQLSVRPKRYDAPGCHVQVLVDTPTDERAVHVGRVRVVADQQRFDESWAIEALAARACTYGANAIVVLRETEALPPRVAHYLNADFAAFEADAFKLP